MYLQQPERTDDEIYQEREARDTYTATWDTCQRLTDLDSTILSRLSWDTMQAIIADLEPDNPVASTAPATPDWSTTCPHCFGDGWIPRGLGREDCPRCHGTGKR